MKFVISFVLVLMSLFTINGQNISVLYSFRTYHSAEKNYVEINTSIDFNTLSFTTNKDNKYLKQAELTTIICSKHNVDSAIYVDKRIICSPLYSDTLQGSNTSLLDMQRIGLSNDTFVVYFSLKDLNNTQEQINYKDGFVIDYKNEEINLSDIMLVDTLFKTKKENIYSKAGYDMYPYLFDIVGKKNNILTFYVESYNSDKTFGNQDYFLITGLEKIGENKKIDTMIVTKKFKSQPITPYIGKMDITNLSEGDYYLTIEIRGKNNILYAYKKYPFYKQSDIKPLIVNEDIVIEDFVLNMDSLTLKETIKSLRPIADEKQLKYILKESKHTPMQEDRYFIYEFFKKINTINPSLAYKEFKAKLDYVNNKYSTPIKKGWQTDMGRVVMIYGLPNDIIDEKFAASSGLEGRSLVDKQTNFYAPNIDPDGVNYYPYQIWVYNSTVFGESNRKFVFYAKQNNLAEYFLLHSNAKGELQDMYWERTLSKNTLDAGVEGKAGKQFRVGHR